SLVRNGRGGQAARGDVERDLPPMVHVRAERQPYFADDLGPHVQRRAGGLPGLERQRRPVPILLVHPRAPFARLASAYPHAADAARRSRRRSTSILQRSAANGELPFAILAQGIETPRPGAGEGQVEEHKAEQDREIAAI